MNAIAKCHSSLNLKKRKRIALTPLRYGRSVQQDFEVGEF